jgi:threonine dehydrogenase-like Zn-dependent dehydrogenase
MYLPWNAVLHKVPKGVSPELAGIVTPMANGIEWALFDCGVGYNSSVLIQGPGQQGMAQTVACKQAGASCIIVTGTAKDVKRLEVAKKLGADYTINVSEEDPLERIMEITGGIGVDVSLECTSGAGTIPVMLGVEALKRTSRSVRPLSSTSRSRVQGVTDTGLASWRYNSLPQIGSHWIWSRPIPTRWKRRTRL